MQCIQAGKMYTEVRYVRALLSVWERRCPRIFDFPSFCIPMHDILECDTSPLQNKICTIFNAHLDSAATKECQCAKCVHYAHIMLISCLLFPQFFCNRFIPGILSSGYSYPPPPPPPQIKQHVCIYYNTMGVHVQNLIYWGGEARIFRGTVYPRHAESDTPCYIGQHTSKHTERCTPSYIGRPVYCMADL